MAIVETALVAGVAPGAAGAGQVIDSQGPSTAYLVSLGAGLVAAAAAFATRDEPACAPDPVSRASRP
jgi:predicted MFS family arabinose efflux permease